MRKSLHVLSFLLMLAVALPGVLESGVDIKDTKLLSQPAISQTHIAFAYANDLWVANIDGKGVRRLTSAQGSESNPIFSPDGKLIAFNGEYDGNVDIFVAPVEGGVPKRLTWHPGSDVVRDFTPCGSSVLFISSRNTFTYGYSQLFTVPVEGDFPESLLIPNANLAHRIQRLLSGKDSPARRLLQRHRPDVDRGENLFSFGPEWRIQPVLVRPEIKRDQTAHFPHGLSCDQGFYR